MGQSSKLLRQVGTGGGAVPCRERLAEAPGQCQECVQRCHDIREQTVAREPGNQVLTGSAASSVSWVISRKPLRSLASVYPSVKEGGGLDSLQLCSEIDVP